MSFVTNIAYDNYKNDISDYKICNQTTEITGVYLITKNSIVFLILALANGDYAIKMKENYSSEEFKILRNEYRNISISFEYGTEGERSLRLTGYYSWWNIKPITATAHTADIRTDIIEIINYFASQESQLTRHFI